MFKWQTDCAETKKRKRSYAFHVDSDCEEEEKDGDRGEKVVEVVL